MQPAVSGVQRTEVKATSVSTLKNFIGGKFTESRALDYLPVTNPALGEVIAEVPLSGPQDVDDAVRAAAAAFPAWSKTPIKERAQVFYRYKTLLEKNINELASLINKENGKIMSEAIAEMERAIEVVEFASSTPQLSGGEIL